MSREHIEFDLHDTLHRHLHACTSICTAAARYAHSHGGSVHERADGGGSMSPPKDMERLATPSQLGDDVRRAEPLRAGQVQSSKHDSSETLALMIDLSPLHQRIGHIPVSRRWNTNTASKMRSKIATRSAAPSTPRIFMSSLRTNNIDDPGSGTLLESERRTNEKAPRSMNDK